MALLVQPNNSETGRHPASPGQTARPCSQSCFVAGIPLCWHGQRVPPVVVFSVASRRVPSSIVRRFVREPCCRTAASLPVTAGLVGEMAPVSWGCVRPAPGLRSQHPLEPPRPAGLGAGAISHPDTLLAAALAAVNQARAGEPSNRGDTVTNGLPARVSVGQRS